MKRIQHVCGHESSHQDVKVRLTAWEYNKGHPPCFGFRVLKCFVVVAGSTMSSRVSGCAACLPASIGERAGITALQSGDRPQQTLHKSHRYTDWMAMGIEPLSYLCNLVCCFTCRSLPPWLSRSLAAWQAHSHKPVPDPTRGNLDATECCKSGARPAWGWAELRWAQWG